MHRKSKLYACISKKIAMIVKNKTHPSFKEAYPINIKTINKIYMCVSYELMQTSCDFKQQSHIVQKNMARKRSSAYISNIPKLISFAL